MSKLVSIAKAKAEFASLVSRAEGGEEILVTRNGKPVARLMPLEPPRSDSWLGDLPDLVISDDLSLPDDLWEKFEDPEGR
jgi:prevent-host-death family protein